MNQDEAADSCWLRWRWLSSGDEQGGASTSYTSMQKLKQDFALIDISEFQRLLGQKGFELVEQENRSLPEVNNTHGDPVKTGSLYHVKDIGAEDIKGITQDDEWFTEHIIVQDKTVTIRLNGKEVVKWTQPPDWNGGREGAGRVIGHGTIALQGHDPKSTVHYKNIRIKPLP